MDAFEQALLCFDKSPAIPTGDDWYAPLIGDWRFDKGADPTAGWRVWRCGQNIQPNESLL